MRLIAALCLTLLLSVATVFTSGHPSTNLALIHVNIVDTSTQALLRDQTVLIVSGRISAVAPSARTSPPKGAQVIDGHGKFLMAGVLGMHLHLPGGRDT